MAVLRHYYPPVIINSSRGEALWVMPAEARKRKTNFRSQALHWESFRFKGTASFRSQELYYCTTVPLYYCTTVLFQHYTIVLLYYFNTVLLYYCTSVLLYYCTTAVLY